METTIQTHRGLSNFHLKYLAMFLMVLDHIHYFFEFTGKIPLAFSWAGRLAAPLFLFCIIEGFLHTHDRKKYFFNIYGLSILMGLIQFSFYNVGVRLVRGDGFFPQNQMLASFALLLLLLQGFDWCSQKKFAKGIGMILSVLFVPLAVFILLANVIHAGFLANVLAFTVLPVHFFILDGGTSTLVMGALLYLFHRHPKRQAAAFVIMVVLWDVVRIILLMPGITFTEFFTLGYQWMEVFAVIPMLCYNKTRGHGSKSLFYWFYPVHIYLFYALSCVIFPLLK